ncbi:MAG: hypothetical protein WC352_09230, partial [Candidatus Omnitrophota bacterium]
MTRPGYFNEPTQLEIHKRIVRWAFLISFAVFCVFFITTLSSWRSSLEMLQSRQKTLFHEMTSEMVYRMENEFHHSVEFLRYMQTFYSGR